MQALINGKTLELARGDITKQEADAIVNAANSGLRGAAFALALGQYERQENVRDE